MMKKSMNVLVIVAPVAILRFDGSVVRNKRIEVISRIKNKMARMLPCNARVRPLSLVSVSDNQGRNVRIRTAKFTPSAVLRRPSSLSFEKE